MTQEPSKLNKHQQRAREIVLSIKEFMEYGIYLEIPEGSEPDQIELLKAQRGLWAILTGLRGPDDEDLDKKKAMTEPIRHAIFENPRIGWKVGFCMGNCYFKHPHKVRDNHFRFHAEMAVQALGNLGFPVPREDPPIFYTYGG